MEKDYASLFTAFYEHNIYICKKRSAHEDTLRVKIARQECKCRNDVAKHQKLVSPNMYTPVDLA